MERSIRTCHSGPSNDERGHAHAILRSQLLDLKFSLIIIIII